MSDVSQGPTGPSGGSERPKWLVPVLACGALFLFLILVGLVSPKKHDTAAKQTVNLEASSSPTSTEQQTTSTTAEPTTTTTTVIETTTTAPPPVPPPTAAPSTTRPPVATTTPLDCPNGTYVNSDGVEVCRPYSSPTGPPAGATARCKDGSYSFSTHRSGTCSGHGGVAEWL